MTLLIQNFARIQNMPILKGSNDHRRPPSSLIKIWRILHWRTQNPSITRYMWIWGHSPQYGSWHGQWPSICTQYNFTTLKVVLRPELKLCKSLVLKWNQVYEKTASKQPQKTRCNFSMIFVCKWTDMRHLRPY